MKQQKIHIIDCTLREGNQSPGVNFTVQDSVRIANALPNPGVEMIEAGHPYVSQLQLNRVKAVVNLGKFPVLAHARAKKEDISAVIKSGAQWVGIFAGINSLSQKYRLNRNKLEIYRLIKDSIAYAKHNDLKVRFTIEDASRTGIDELLPVYRMAISEGADRICFSDTVGILEPLETKVIIDLIKNQLNFKNLEVHFHDDRGLAMANTLAAIDGGANWISASVNGMGERAGITDTCALVANLVHKKLTYKTALKDILYLSSLVQAISSSPVDERRPVIGRNAFIHTAKLHLNAMNLNVKSYEWMDKNLLKSSILKSDG